ncbi:hypothetical protein [Neofamilia massiliensis]|uniref:hypothetical protein n=1 Tax=Neofamilia massiliensis TaxID=1673724 RepID=UPI0006BB8962|nr:hypothetical protein [Neofamilia massiliensis]
MNLKNFVCTLLACIFLLSNTAYALEENRIQTLPLKDTVNEIEKDGINIETELKNQIKMYRDLLENEKDLKEQEKLSSASLATFYALYSIPVRQATISLPVLLS